MERFGAAVVQRGAAWTEWSCQESRRLAALGQQGVRRVGPHAAAIMASCVEPATRTLSPPYLQRAARPL